MKGAKPPLVTLALIAIGIPVFLAGTAFWAERPPDQRMSEGKLQVVPPPPAAVAMALGDRYLASDLASVRAAIAMDRMDDDQDKAQLARMLDLSLSLNPAHEDAYYLTEATLPWQGRVEWAQDLLNMAEKARPWDWMPPFFRAFNRYYFLREPVAGARILKEAAERAGPERGNRLRAMAARWSALGRSPQRALDMVRAMAQGTTSRSLRRNLEMRAQQLRGLIRLREAAEAYRSQHHRPPETPEALVGYAGLEAVPKDPAGDGYIVADSGEMRVRPPDYSKVSTPGDRGRQ